MPPCRTAECQQRSPMRRRCGPAQAPHLSRRQSSQQVLSAQPASGQLPGSCAVTAVGEIDQPDDVGADGPLEVVRCALATMRPEPMIPTRSASSSASSRYWVVRKIVMPSSVFSHRTSSHNAVRLMAVEAGRGLVEEQHVGVVDQRRREVEPPLHAAPRTSPRCAAGPPSRSRATSWPATRRGPRWVRAA